MSTWPASTPSSTWTRWARWSTAPGEARGTAWHPHRGFETATYIVDGTFEHQDSIGGGGVITNGDTQWMTAGGGIRHIERPPESLVVSGGTFHGVQLWVNLPSAQKWAQPRYQDIRAGNATLLTTPDGGALVRVIAGEVAGHEGPGVTHTPMAFVHATLSPGAQLVLPWRAGVQRPRLRPERQRHRRAWLGEWRRRPFRMGQLAVFDDGDYVTVTADATQESRSPNLDVLVLGGRPIREPVAWYGPFVMNTRAEILQALQDAESGRLGTTPASSLSS